VVEKGDIMTCMACTYGMGWHTMLPNCLPLQEDSCYMADHVVVVHVCDKLPHAASYCGWIEDVAHICMCAACGGTAWALLPDTLCFCDENVPRSVYA